MIDLFGTPWDQLSVDRLAAWLEGAEEEGVTWEAKADDERGRLRIHSVRKAGCGLANRIGGYIILGARFDREAKEWSLPGVTIPDPEPRKWIGKAIRSLNPEPRHKSQVWQVDGGRTVAVVWVDAVDAAPCMTLDGRVYERVTGETIPVEDPALLARLFDRGDAARRRAESFADRAAKRAMRIDWREDRAVGVAVAMAAIGRETNDITSRLFVPSFREELVKSGWGLWGGGRPAHVEVRQEQDGLSFLGHFYDAADLARGRDPSRVTWVLTAIWDGTLVASAHFGSGATFSLATVESVIQPGWQVIAPLVERLGGYGPAQVSIYYRCRQRLVGPDAPMIDDQAVPRARLLRELPSKTWIRRWAEVAAPSSEQIGSVQRELQRASGQESFEEEAE